MSNQAIARHVGNHRGRAEQVGTLAEAQDVGVDLFQKAVKAREKARRLKISKDNMDNEKLIQQTRSVTLAIALKNTREKLESCQLAFIALEARNKGLEHFESAFIASQERNRDLQCEVKKLEEIILELEKNEINRRRICRTH